jgi:hypothetical protein
VNDTPQQEPKTKPRKPKKELVEVGERGLTFRNLDSMYRFCVAVANSKEFADIDTPEQALMRVQAGAELGLSPIWSLTNIMIIHGRPSVWGDAMLGLVLNHPECEDVIETIENEGTEDETARCEVRRRGRVPVVRKFSIADVRRAGLDRKVQSVHGSYPKRMRQMRARSWALRDAFADALRGLVAVEEVRDNGKVVARETPKAKDVILPDEVEMVSASSADAAPSGEKPSAQQPISQEQLGLNPEAPAESEKKPGPTHSGPGNTSEEDSDELPF